MSKKSKRDSESTDNPQTELTGAAGAIIGCPTDLDSVATTFKVCGTYARQTKPGETAYVECCFEDWNGHNNEGDPICLKDEDLVGGKWEVQFQVVQTTQADLTARLVVDGNQVGDPYGPIEIEVLATGGNTCDPCPPL